MGGERLSLDFVMKKILPLLLVSLPLWAAQPPQYWPPRWPTPWHGGQIPSAAVASPFSKEDGAGKVGGANGGDAAVGTDAGDGEGVEQARERYYRQALGHMRQGDYAKAYCLWAPLAQAGHAEAQFSLGWMYHNGYGLNIDNRKTVEWWQAAAEAGLASAAFALGMLYSQGDAPLERDLAKAAGYYRQAAAAGNDEAVSMLYQLFNQHPDEMAEVSADWDQAAWRSLEGGVLRVKAARANVRAGPSTEHDLLDSLAEGAELVKVFEQGDWIYARLGETGEAGEPGDCADAGEPSGDCPLTLTPSHLPREAGLSEASQGGRLVWIYSPLVEPVSSESAAAGPASPEGM